jgi:RHH-type transcriptional regulator, rel operon repressor / antitoxin RelB
MLSIEIPEEIAGRLCRLAKESGQSESDYVLNVLLEYLEDMDDLRIAVERLEDIRTGRSKPIPLEEVMREYGMGD